MFGFTAILLAVCLTQSHHLIDFLPLVWFRWRGLPFLSLSLGRVGWKQQRQKFAPPPSTPSGQPRNPAGGPQRDTSRTDLHPGDEWSGFRKENLFQRKSESRVCSREECCPRRSQKKLEKQQMGNEYWARYDGSHSIKIANEKVIGTGCLVVGFR